MKIGMLISGLGSVLFALGGLTVGIFFFYGIYHSIFNDVKQGLMVIGASVVSTFLVRMLSGLLMVAGNAISTKAIEKEINK